MVTKEEKIFFGHHLKTTVMHYPYQKTLQGKEEEISIRRALNIDVTTGFKSGLSIHGRTYTRSGCRVTIYDEDGQSMFMKTYVRDLFPVSFSQMARDAAETMNLLFELADTEERIGPEALAPVMRELFEKCESRFGAPLPDSDYEVLVKFAA